MTKSSVDNLIYIDDYIDSMLQQVSVFLRYVSNTLTFFFIISASH